MKIISAIMRNRHRDAYAFGLIGFFLTAMIQLPPIIEARSADSQAAAELGLGVRDDYHHIFA